MAELLNDVSITELDSLIDARDESSWKDPSGSMFDLNHLKWFKIYENLEQKDYLSFWQTSLEIPQENRTNDNKSNSQNVIIDFVDNNWYSPKETLINNLSKRLNFSESVIKLATDLYYSHPERDHVVISQTQDQELLYYIESKNSFRNILFDEFGNIELMIIPKDNNPAKSKIFYSEDQFSVDEVVKHFNALL